MLGKKDIIKELGKGINISPFNGENLKENSVNLSIGDKAWTLGNGTVVNKGREEFILKASELNKADYTINIKKGDSAIYEIEGIKYLLLLPHCTTIIETKEVIAVGNHIGGTFHSKVGIVAQGIGDIGTMLGPCFSGHLMVSLHNISDEIKTLKVGDTFVSLVFYYLKSPMKISKNSNTSGHLDKLSELGIMIDSDTRKFLDRDWKKDIKEVSRRMKEEDDYKKYRNAWKIDERNEIFQYFNLVNLGLIVFALFLLIGLGIGAHILDVKNGSTIWSDRYWTVVVTSVLSPVFLAYLSLLKRR